MLELWSAFAQFIAACLNLAGALLSQALVFALPLFAIMFALFAIDWRKLAPTLRGGAAIPLVMLSFLIGAAWGGIAPSELNLLGWRAPNFIWQTAVVFAGLGVLLYCGWLQMKAGWFPQTIELNPAPAHGHDGHHH